MYLNDAAIFSPSLDLTTPQRIRIFFLIVRHIRAGRSMAEDIRPVLAALFKYKTNLKHLFIVNVKCILPTRKEGRMSHSIARPGRMSRAIVSINIFESKEPILNFLLREYFR